MGKPVKKRRAKQRALPGSNGALGMNGAFYGIQSPADGRVGVLQDPTWRQPTGPSMAGSNGAIGMNGAFYGVQGFAGEGAAERMRRILARSAAASGGYVTPMGVRGMWGGIG